MIELSFRVPLERAPGYMIGSLPEVPGTPSYALTAGNIGGWFLLGSFDGVLSVALSSYTDLTYPVLLEGTRTVGMDVTPFTITLIEGAIVKNQAPVIYVDPSRGRNENSGSQEWPVASFDVAYEKVAGGGNILLYGGHYGHRKIARKPVTVKGLTGHTARFENLEVMESTSVVVDSLHFWGSSGFVADNTTGDTRGSITVRKCTFEGARGIEVKSYRYLSLLQNRVHTSSMGMQILNVDEAAVVSNIVAGLSGAIPSILHFESVPQLDFIHNTVHNGGTAYFDDTTTIASYGVTYISLDADMITNKQLPAFPANFLFSGGVPLVSINLTSGATSGYPVDFDVSGAVISWAGKGLDEPGVLEVGDILRVSYQLVGGSGGGNGSLFVESSSMTSLANIQFSSGLFTQGVRNNNFFGSTLTITPGPSQENIAADPLYLSPGTGDFALSAGSPNIVSASTSLGIPYTISSVTPFQQFQDFYGANRVPKGVAPDIGAVEYLASVHNRVDPPIYLGQQGYDVTFDGASLKPVRRLSRAFADGTQDDISMDTGAASLNVSDRKMYFDESTIPLDDAEILIRNPRMVGNGYPSQPDAAVLKRDSAFIQPVDAPGFEGTKVYVSMDGDDAYPGTIFQPFRTIGQALESSAEIIVVLAGSYPLFTGKTNKHIVFMPRLDFTIHANAANTFLDVDTWEITEETDVVFTQSLSQMTIVHP